MLVTTWKTWPQGYYYGLQRILVQGRSLGKVGQAKLVSRRPGHVE